jgi:hypothetical protein
MNEFTTIENRILQDLEIDLVPLNDIVREFSGFKKLPTEEDFLKTLEFLKFFLNNNRIRCLEGSDMKEVNISNNLLIEKLKKKWYDGLYSHIDYSIWFYKI